MTKDIFKIRISTVKGRTFEFESAMSPTVSEDGLFLMFSSRRGDSRESVDFNVREIEYYTTSIINEEE